mmetsp:Transcript_28880/g.47112  ORF Transcript_28880/g.47112 Transcript_28880/m.47112 type:complete len:146 (+) Transcript_28880:1660-2097(+)
MEASVVVHAWPGRRSVQTLRLLDSVPRGAATAASGAATTWGWHQIAARAGTAAACNVRFALDCSSDARRSDTAPPPVSRPLQPPAIELVEESDKQREEDFRPRSSHQCKLAQCHASSPVFPELSSADVAHFASTQAASCTIWDRN